MVYVRVSLREGTIPLEQMLGAEGAQQSWHVANPNVLGSDDTIEAVHKQKKNSKLRCLIRHYRQKKRTNLVGEHG